MISRFDRHLLAEWTRTFVFSTLMISVILMASTQLLPWISTVSDYAIPLVHATQLLVCQLPGIFLYAVPMGSLCASLVSISQLNQQLAIVSVRAMGISIPRIIQPVIGISLLLSFLSIGINEYGVAPSNQLADRITQQFTKTATDPMIHYQAFTPQGHLAYSLTATTHYDSTTLHKATLVEYEQSRIIRITRAENAHWQAPSWVFSQGLQFTIHSNRIQSTPIQTPWKTTMSIPPDQLVAADMRADQLTSQALKAQIEHKQATGRFNRDDQFNWHVKFSLPFTSLTFAIIGALMSFSFQRTRSASNIGLGVGIIIAYYVLLSITMGLCLLGWIYPVIAAWSPNAVLLTISLIWHRANISA
ncbi:MAG: hypothetical protein CMJ93_06110 [Planctomycetes bacterium]|nr:hypothetical protein [Planctomycetota bacterium]